jgi:outer membrane lipoprotein-sorting protein
MARVNVRFWYQVTAPVKAVIVVTVWPVCMRSETAPLNVLDVAMNRFLKFTLPVCLSLLTFVPLAASVEAAGKKEVSIALSETQIGAVQKINAYFNSFQSLRGDFTQISPKGQATRGVLSLAKPGNIRFDYAPPNPLLIVSDGKWLTIMNRTKQKGDQVPLKSTPLRLIVAPKIDLLAEANILAFEQADGLTTVALSDKKGSLGGHIILTFDETSNELQQWVVVDGKGRRTTVQFANLEKNVKFDKKIFLETIKRNTN